MSFFKQFGNLLWTNIKITTFFLNCSWEIFLTSLIGEKIQGTLTSLQYTTLHYTTLHYTEVYQWEVGIWTCDLRDNEGPKKNCMRRGQQINGHCNSMKELAKGPILWKCPKMSKKNVKFCIQHTYLAIYVRNFWQLLGSTF